MAEISAFSESESPALKTKGNPALPHPAPHNAPDRKSGSTHAPATPRAPLCPPPASATEMFVLPHENPAGSMKNRPRSRPPASLAGNRAPWLAFAYPPEYPARHPQTRLASPGIAVLSALYRGPTARCVRRETPVAIAP